MIAFYQHSSKTITYSLPGVPVGQTITKAIWMLKRQETDPDVDAIVTIEATTPGGTPGDLIDSSAPTGSAAFLIGQDALDSVRPGLYIVVVKVILANGNAYETPASRETAILKAGAIDDQN
jgi:hypothetical protein